MTEDTSYDVSVSETDTLLKLIEITRAKLLSVTVSATELETLLELERQKTSKLQDKVSELSQKNSDLESRLGK